MSYRHSIGYLLTTDSEIYRCIDTAMVVVSGYAINTESSTARQFYLSHVPADESADEKFSVLNNQNISAKGSYELENPIILSPGESLYARASVIEKVVLTLYIIPYGDYVSRIV
tara:strand:- start:1241 stop:1582 length:342 start_codon:yes stop_codon:yes gene_type:complete